MSDPPAATGDALDVEALSLEDDRIDRLDDNRFVIEAGDGGPTDDDGDVDRPPLSDVADRFAVDVSVKTDRGVRATRFSSNDVRTVFESLLRWYAARLDPDDRVENALAILLEASDVPNGGPEPRCTRTN